MHAAPQHARVPDRPAPRSRRPTAPKLNRPASDVARPAPARVGPRENALHAPEYLAMRKALQAARLAAGLTLDEVATRLGRPISYVWKSEQGERRVDAVELWRFAGLYGRAVGDFLPPHAYRPHHERERRS